MGKQSTLFESWKLPPEATQRIGEKFNQQVEQCKAAWEATRDPFAVAEAHTLHSIYQVPSPAWLDQAVVNICIAKRPKTVRKRYLEAMIDFARWNEVRALREQGRKEWWHKLPSDSADALTWDEAYALVLGYARGTESEAT
jgi:hypothetical protein